ncbi:hypothetical protein BVRB_8g194290 [Beta vulgaris subsp. vulgaris]|nr:hypothetical protein BVRB_8g194290 [Beta vulgaris subsp. vulgaris]
MLLELHVKSNSQQDFKLKRFSLMARLGDYLHIEVPFTLHHPPLFGTKTRLRYETRHQETHKYTT